MNGRPWMADWFAVPGMVRALGCLVSLGAIAGSASPQSTGDRGQQTTVQPSISQRTERGESSVSDGHGRPPTAIVAVPRKVERFVNHLLQRCDADGDGRLQRSEWPRLSAAASRMDLDSDGLITRLELTQCIADYGGRRWRAAAAVRSRANPTLGSRRTGAAADGHSAAELEEPGTPRRGDTPLTADEIERRRRQRKYYVPRARLPAGTPTWFLERDSDGDAQLTLGEFGGTRNAARLREFQRLDHNGDGLLTARESLRPVAADRP